MPSSPTTMTMTVLMLQQRVGSEDAEEWLDTSQQVCVDIDGNNQIPDRAKAAEHLVQSYRRNKPTRVIIRTIVTTTTDEEFS